MNLEKVKYFIDLVECRSFTDTAKKNYVSQTTISQQIASLEKDFGIQLFDRKKIPVEPTPAGWVFYEEALILWKQYEFMQKKMKDYLIDNELVLRIEYAGIMDIRSLLPVITKLKEMHPNVRIELNKVRLKDVSDYLQKGLYDIAVAFDSEFVGKDNIKTETLVQGSYNAIVSRQHPFSRRDKIQIEELYQQPLVMLDPTIIGDSYNQMLKRAQEDGYTPNIVRTADDVESELFYILTEGLLGFFPENYEFEYHLDQMKIIPIENSNHQYKIVIATSKENSNPAIPLFMKAMSIGKTNDL